MSVTKPAAAPRKSAPNADTAIDFDPFSLDNHGRALLDRGAIIAPVLVSWQYRILRADAFQAWLGMKEIVLAPGRMSQDALLEGIRYAGTYRVASDTSAAVYRTLWGYGNETAMRNMDRLCRDPAPSITIIQGELLDFVRGLRTFLGEAGPEHFVQEVLTAADGRRP